MVYLIAIILNSGIGTRMGETTQKKPKCLVELNHGESILERQIRLLIENNIPEIIMTTGPFEEKVKEHVREQFPNVEITYINNPQYSKTNYIYSLHLIPKNLIYDDILLMHGDLVFGERVLKSILKSRGKNVVIINSSVPIPKKDFKGRFQNGILQEISVNLFGSNSFLLMPIYKLSQKDFLVWMDEIGDFVRKGQINVYAEDAFNKISDKIIIHPIDLKGELCMEIDTLEDLTIVRNALN